MDLFPALLPGSKQMMCSGSHMSHRLFTLLLEALRLPRGPTSMWPFWRTSTSLGSSGVLLPGRGEDRQGLQGSGSLSTATTNKHQRERTTSGELLPQAQSALRYVGRRW